MHLNRPWLANLAAVALALALLFSALELAVRLFCPEQVDTETLSSRQETFSLGRIVQPSPDTAVLYELRPSLDTFFRGERLATSSDGRRVDPRARLEPQDEPMEPELRIALLGDSTSFGLGVAYEETYGELYRRRMEGLTGLAIELRNYSVPGYNARQAARVFETKVAPRQPDLVILHHDHNDSQPAVRSVPAGYLAPEHGDNVLGSAALKWLVRRLALARQRIAREVDREEHAFVEGYVSAGPLFDAHLEARRELARGAARLGAPAVAVLFVCCAKRQQDYEETALYRLLHRSLGDRLTAMGYVVLDLLPRYQLLMVERGWADPSPLWNSAKDRHPNPRGHAFIAEQLVELSMEAPELARIFGREP